MCIRDRSYDVLNTEQVEEFSPVKTAASPKSGVLSTVLDGLTLLAGGGVSQTTKASSTTTKTSSTTKSGKSNKTATVKKVPTTSTDKPSNGPVTRRRVNSTGTIVPSTSATKVSGASSKNTAKKRQHEVMSSPFNEKNSRSRLSGGLVVKNPQGSK